MLVASPWFVATDADQAGDKSAGGWPARARRVRPPGAFKDWTEAHQGGVNLRRWWSDRLEGTEAPPLFSWEELAARNSEPGIVVDKPDRARTLAALEAAKLENDPYVLAEREAIQTEHLL
jgi:hypothetical protein